jgi:hypothetical protein
MACSGTVLLLHCLLLVLTETNLVAMGVLWEKRDSQVRKECTAE